MNRKELQIKNSLIYLLPILVKNVLPLITIPIFTRILSPEDFGFLALAMIYSTFINGLANFGLGTAYTRDYFENNKSKIEASQLLFSIIIFVMAAFICLATLSFIFRLYLSNLIMGNPQYGNLLFWALIAQFFVAINDYYFSYYKNSENANMFAASTIFLTLLNISLSIYFIVFIRSGVIGLVYAQSISGFFIWCILTYLFINNLNISFNIKKLVGSLKISLPLTPKIFVGLINTQFDKYMISLLASVGGVGIYSIAQRISNSAWEFMGALQNVFSPQMYKTLFSEDSISNRLSIGKYLSPFIYIAIFPTFLLSLFSDELIRILTPPNYHGAINIVSILCIYYGVVLFRKFYAVQIIFSKKTFIILAESILSLSLNIGLNIILIKNYGVIGAAIATLITGFITVSIFFSIAQKLVTINWEFRKILMNYSCFVGFTLAIIVMRYFNFDYFILLTIKLFAVYIYIVLGFSQKVISKENLLIVKNTFARS